MPKGVYPHSHKFSNAKGKHWKLSEETKRKIGDRQRGEKNYMWVGDNVGYRGIHHWVKKWKGETTQCEVCGKLKTTPRSIHWCNIDHKYRRVLEDYIQMCSKCHGEYDKIKGLRKHKNG